jgi:hypothetical protein
MISYFLGALGCGLALAFALGIARLTEEIGDSGMSPAMQYVVGGLAILGIFTVIALLS